MEKPQEVRRKLPVSTGNTSEPQAGMLSPDEAVAELRALIARVPEVVELTTLERETLRRSAAMPDSAIQAAIGVLDVSDDVAHVVGQPEDVRQRYKDDGRWATFETELKIAWKKIADTNVVRCQRTRLLALQAYRIAQQLARTPGNEGLNVHVKEVMRLRNAGRRKKAAAQTPEAPAPGGENTRAPDSVGVPSPAGGARDDGGSSNTK